MNIYIPVILKIVLFIFLLYIPLPIVLFIYRRRKTNPGEEAASPKAEDFTASGNFQGFKINASGSVALYFILFVACLSSSIPIVHSIDETQTAGNTINGLTISIDSLLRHTPWKLKYSIRLMTDSTKAVSNDAYNAYLNPQHFHSFPPALDMDANTHVVTCYIDEELFEMNNNNYTVNIDSFNSGFELHIDSARKKWSSRTIDLGVIPVFKFSNAAAPYAPIAAITSPGLDKSQLPAEPQFGAR